MASYRVVANTQVHVEGVDNPGVTYTGGEKVPLDDKKDAERIAYWLHAGWIEEVPTKAAKRRST